MQWIAEGTQPAAAAGASMSPRQQPCSSTGHWAHCRGKLCLRDRVEQSWGLGHCCICLVCPRTPRLGQHGVTKQIPHAQSSVSGSLAVHSQTIQYWSKALMEWFPHLCDLVATAARPTNDARSALPVSTLGYLDAASCSPQPHQTLQCCSLKRFVCERSARRLKESPECNLDGLSRLSQRMCALGENF